MIRAWYRLLALTLLCSLACAQDLGTGMEITGFRVPDYDAQGNLRAQLYGQHAKVLDGGEVEITNLKIEMYREGEVAMTVFSPHCFFNMETRQARSDGRVLIESGLMTVAGEGFVWSADAGRFEILNHSKILVKPSARDNIEELGL